MACAWFQVFYGIAVDTEATAGWDGESRWTDTATKVVDALDVPPTLSPRFCGEARLTDPIRADAKEFIDHLRSTHGVRVKLLSGDRSPSLTAVADRLGIPPADVACCLPAEKAAMVQALRSDGECVVMVGDGANDSAALAAADVGVSIGVNELASSASDVVLSGREDSLHTLLQLMTVAKTTVNIATAGVKYGMSASVLQMVLAAAGLIKPTTSAMLQECVDLVTVVNAVRAL